MSYLLILLGSLFVIAEPCKQVKYGRKLLNDTLAENDIVLTGTIQFVSQENDDIFSKIITIKVRRVFKGLEHIPFYNFINVHYHGQITCRRLLTNGSTRIFAISAASSDSLVLTGPVLPINLGLLDALHAIVHRTPLGDYFQSDKGYARKSEKNGQICGNSMAGSPLRSSLPHRKRRKARKTKCETHLCPLGSKCVHSTGHCECRASCRTNGSPVCGSDHVTYASSCHLHVRSCLLKRKGKKLRISNYGNCKQRNPCDDLTCGPGEDCVVTQTSGLLAAECICPKSCPKYGDSVDSSPICSSNGVDYPSLCHMKQHACSAKLNITVKYFGKCDPCAGFSCPTSTVCQLTELRKPICRCSEQCSLRYEPVCGDDGNTYVNECMMKVAACKEERTVNIYKKGVCGDRSPCRKLNCTHGSMCQISKFSEKNVTAECRCIEKCPSFMRPVCATNGATFDNACELNKAACQQKLRISVKHEGSCGEGLCSVMTTCEPPKVCSIEDGKVTCSCPKCGDELREVCGSDGRTYPNECKMKRAACISGKPLFVKYNGICEGCQEMECEFYSFCVSVGIGKGECRCPSECPRNSSDGTKISPVCGTDGVTYSTECHLRKSACQQRKFIVKAFDGKCDACLSVECRYGEECIGGKCVCSYNCPSNPAISARVCGENRIVYPSECHLQLAACKQGAPIAEMNFAHCHSDVSSFLDERCNCNKIGSLGPDCDDANQCRCRPGVGGKKCDHCLSNFYGIHLIANGAPSCQPCGCSVFGSSRPDCEQSTGRCECRPGVIGEKCDQCAEGYILTPSGCVQKEEYRTPSSCLRYLCHHGAVCRMSPSGFPDCRCPEKCDFSHLGIAANMTVCGSDGVTYDSFCHLTEFACRHQLDLRVVSLGICSADSIAQADRRKRRKERIRVSSRRRQ